MAEAPHLGGLVRHHPAIHDLIDHTAIPPHDPDYVLMDDVPGLLDVLGGVADHQSGSAQLHGKATGTGNLIDGLLPATIVPGGYQSGACVLAPPSEEGLATVIGLEGGRRGRRDDRGLARD